MDACAEEQTPRLLVWSLGFRAEGLQFGCRSRVWDVCLEVYCLQFTTPGAQVLQFAGVKLGIQESSILVLFSRTLHVAESAAAVHGDPGKYVAASLIGPYQRLLKNVPAECTLHPTTIKPSACPSSFSLSMSFCMFVFSLSRCRSALSIDNIEEPPTGSQVKTTRQLQQN